MRQQIGISCRTIAAAIPDMHNPYFLHIVSGIEQEANRHDCVLLICNLNRTQVTAERFASFIHERQVGHVILAGGGSISLGSRQIWSDLAQSVNIISIGHFGLSCPTVSVDDVRGAIEAVSHLTDLGHRRIAFVCGPSDSVPALQRLEGYLSVLFAQQIPYLSDLVLEGDFTVGGGYLAGQALLALSERPTAVFCCNDLLAIGMIRALSEAGVRVPTDISVVGYDGLPSTLQHSPVLTTITVPMEQLGREAVRLLLVAPDGPAGNQSVILPTGMQLGETTARPIPFPTHSTLIPI